jgi:hypothetical protein
MRRDRVLQNKHQAVSQDGYFAWGMRLEAQNKFRPGQPGFQLSASSFQLPLCEHLQ